MHLVTSVHVWPHDKDDGHTIRSAGVKNPVLHANFMALCFIEHELLPTEVLYCRNRNFRPFWLLRPWPDPMTFIYELDLYALEIYRICENQLPMSIHSKVIFWQTDRHTDRQTDRQTDIQTGPKLHTTLLCGWSIIAQKLQNTHN